MSHAANKTALAPLRAAQYDWDDGRDPRRAGRGVRARRGVQAGPSVRRDDRPAHLSTTAPSVLRAAWPDVERRDWIVMAGHR